jgi:protein TonB
MTTSIFDRNWLNIVFEGRNKEYGAFRLRLINSRAVLIATAVSVVMFLVVMALPDLIKALGSKGDEEGTGQILQDVELMDIKPLEELVPPPPEIEPPPLRDEIVFTPPEIVEEVTTEEVVTQEDFEEAEASTQTREGDTSGVSQSLDLDADGPDITGDVGPRKIFTFVEQKPEFPGGEVALQKYVQEHVRYPPLAHENGIEGTVHVEFVVNEDGLVSDPRILRGIGAGCDEEVLRVIKTLPRWKPGRNNGVAVPVYFTMPVKFTLVGD